MRNTKLLKSLLALSLLVVPIGCGKDETTVEPTDEVEVVEEVVEPYFLEETTIVELKDELKKDQEINEDVKAILHFNNGLIHQPVLYDANDLNKYLYCNWETGEYLNYGSITLDTDNDVENNEYMNLILYGHYCYEVADATRKAVFTPLALLMEEENYEDNKYVSLFVNDEIRYYEVGCVYELPTIQVEGIDATPEDLRFSDVYYDEEYFDTYMKAMKEHEYYDTGVEFEYGDHLLTLETCIENNKPCREIVVCKELGRFEVE